MTPSDDSDAGQASPVTAATPAAPVQKSGTLSIHLQSRSGIRFASVRTGRSHRRRWWYGIGAAILVAVVVAAVARAGGPTIPDGGPLAARQASAINGLLDSSTVGRGYLLTALDDINACVVTGSTLSYIRAAASARRDLLGSVGQSVVSDLPNGNEIKADLVTAVQASYNADRAYLAWVLASGDRCPSHNDPAWLGAATANALADKAKQAFVDNWNPVAHKYGLAQRSLTVI